MWAIPAIIGVAVAGAVVLLVVGVVLAVSIERSRHQKVMQQHGHRRKLSKYHRAHLSIGNADYTHIPVPYIHPQRRIHLPFSTTGQFWATVSSDENLQQEMSTINEDANIDRSSSSTVLRTDYVDQLYAPPQPRRTRRQKKIAQIAMRDPPARSPLSAIAELSDHSANKSPMPEEMSADSIRQVIPEQEVWDFQGWQGQGATICDQTVLLAKHLVAPPHCLIRSDNSKEANVSENFHTSRSASVGSVISRAPVERLPTLPLSDNTFHLRICSESRNSLSSVDTDGSSTLWQFNPLPLKEDHESPSQGLYEFDFGLDTSKSPNWATVRLPPRNMLTKLQANPRIETTQKSPPDDGVSQKDTLKSVDGLKVIDASGWSAFHRRTNVKEKNNLPKPQPNFSQDHRRYSMLDHNFLREKQVSKHRSVSPIVSVEDPFISQLPTRPASMFTTDPSSGASYPRHKGHRRQNCVRITNLTPIIPGTRLSKQMQMPDLSEENAVLFKDTEKSVTLPQPPQDDTVLCEEQTSTVPSARNSNTDLIGPLSALPIPTLTRSQSKDCSINAVTEPVKRQSSPNLIAGSFPSFLSISVTPSPLRPHRTSYESPILPSPAYTSANLFPRQSKVRGPRSQPPSHRPRGSGSISPLRNRPTPPMFRKTDPYDLRRSIMMLRSMDSEACLTDSTVLQSIKSVQSSSQNELDAFPAVPRLTRFSPVQDSSTYFLAPMTQSDSTATLSVKPLNFTSALNNMHRAQSAQSIGATSSIWEDISVDDLSEPDLPTPTQLNRFRFLQNQSPNRSGSPQTRPQRPITEDSTKSNTEVSDVHAADAQENRIPYDHVDTVTTPMVRNKGRVDENGNARASIGLGLRIDGTPMSLYDGSGFLKE